MHFWIVLMLLRTLEASAQASATRPTTGSVSEASTVVPITSEFVVSQADIVNGTYIVALNSQLDYNDVLLRHAQRLTFNIRTVPEFFPLEELPGYCGNFSTEQIEEICRDVANVDLVEQDIRTEVPHVMPNEAEEEGDENLASSINQQLADGLEKHSRSSKRQSPQSLWSETSNILSRATRPFKTVITQSTNYNLEMITGQPLGSHHWLGYKHLMNAGHGVHAYVMDSGIGLHEDFHGRVHRMTRGPRSPYTNTAWDSSASHGTNVAGIIGGATVGVAPNVTIIDVKIADEEGGRLSWAIRAVEDVIKRHKSMIRSRGYKRFK